MRASELLLIVRAQNQASGALRRVAGDLRGLSALSGLKQRGQALQIARSQLNLSRQISQNELESIENGRKSIAMEKARAQSVLTSSRAQINASNVAQQFRRNEEAQIRQQVRLSQIHRGLQSTTMPDAIRKEQLALLDAARMKMATLNRQEEILAERAGVAAGAISKQALALRELEASEVKASQRAQVLRNNIANYGDRLRVNTQQIDENNKAIRRVPYDRVATGGRILQHTSRVMEYAGLVLGGTLAIMARNSANFSTSVTLAATQTRKIGQSFVATAKNSDFLQKQILGLMKQFPATADEMSASAYDIYSSLNVTLPGGVKLLKLFNQAAVAGQTGLQEVSSAGITVMNNFRLKVPQVGKAFQTMFAAVRFGRMTFREFVAMMPQLSPAFSAAGFGLREMAQAAAFMTRVMPNTRMAATSLARLTEMFGRKDFIAGAEKMGVRITDIHKRLLPLPDIVDRLAKKFPTIMKAIKAGKGDTELQNIFKQITALGSGKEGTMGTIQGRRALTFLVTQSRLAHQVYKQVAGDQTEFTDALKAMEKTTGVRWGVFVNQLKALALAIGANVVPALLRMEGPVKRLIKWWDGLNDSTKAFIARFATYTAIFMLVGGAVVFLGGTLLRLIGFLGPALGLSTSLGAIFTTVAFAAAALSGNIKALSDILDVITNFAFGSFGGFAITMGIVAASAIKLTQALRGLAAVEGASAGGGILAGIFGGRGIRNTAKGVGRGLSMTSQLSGLGPKLAGLAATAMLIPGPLWIAGAAIAAAAGGMYLWKRHMDAVKKRADELKDTQVKLASLVAAPSQAARGLALGDRSASIQSYIASQGQLNLKLRDQRNHLIELLNLRRELEALKGSEFVDSIKDVNSKISALIGNIRDVEQGSGRASRTLAAVFNNVVRTMQKSGDFGKMRISPAAINDAEKLSIKLGRMLTKKELKLFFKAEVDKTALSKLPVDVRNFIGRMKNLRIQAKIEVKQQNRAQLQRDIHNHAGVMTMPLAVETKRAANEAKKARATIHKLFAPAIHQKIKVDTPPMGQMAAIGAQIDQGIAAGVTANSGIVSSAVAQVIADAKAAADAAGIGHSPYRLFADTVGKNIVTGMVMGMLEQAGLITKAATITINLFQGALLSALDSKKKPTGGMLTKDLQQQVKEMRLFNHSLARLRQRGVPKGLIDDLAALGPEAAGKIAVLARLSAPQLKRYVALWKAAQREITKSVRATQADIKEGLKQLADQAAQNLLETFNTIKSNITSNFFTLFQGPTNLSNMVGDNFTQAMEQYNSSVSDFQSQIKDLNQQLADAQKEAQQRLIDAITQRRDELQSAIGALFSGDWMQGDVVKTKLDWGQKLGFDDLQKDLESQVAKFANWRKDLTSLAARVPPELAKQLEALGPDAVDKLDILNNATDEQLKQYIATWQQGQADIMAVANKTTVDTSDITARVGDILKQIDDVTQKMAQLQMPHELGADDIIRDMKAQQAQLLEFQGILDSLVSRGLPLEFVKQLQEMGPEALPYLRAINSMTDSQMQELIKTWDETHKLINDSTLKMLNTQLSLWFEYGRKIGLNIIAGLATDQDKLAKWFRNLFLSLLEGKKPPNPPPITRDDSNNAGTIPINPVGNGASGTGSRSTQAFDKETIGTNINVEPGGITINANSDESLMTTLERAAFRIRTMVPG